VNARWRKGVIVSATIAGGYLLSWVAVFSAFVGLEYRYVPQYFAASWLGGGELPATIQLFSLSITVVGAVVILVARHFFVSRRVGR
jgi:hypothetical protein